MGQVAASTEPARRRPPPVNGRAPRQRRSIHDEGRFLARLGASAREDAERAVLKLDVLGADRRHVSDLERQLTKRQDTMVAEWEEAAAAARLPLDDIAAERVRHLRRSFRDRVRELLAAAGPGGRA